MSGHIIDRPGLVGGAPTLRETGTPSLTPERIAAVRAEAERLGVEVQDLGGGRIAALARPTPTDPGYLGAAEVLNGPDPTPAKQGALMRAQEDTAASQADFIWSEAHRINEDNNALRTEHAARLGLSVADPQVTAATSADPDYVAPPAVFVPDGAGGQRAATPDEIAGRVARSERYETNRIDATLNKVVAADTKARLSQFYGDRVPHDVVMEQARAHPNWRDVEALPRIESTPAQRTADIATANAYADYTGYRGSGQQRVAAVLGMIRTGGRVSAEVFELDPAHGLAGVGAARVPGGGPGGFLSDTGIAHDIDYFVGRHFGEGPLAAHAELAKAGREPQGLHGIHAAELYTRTFSNRQERATLFELEQDRLNVPETRDYPNYDLGPGPWPDAWSITVLPPRPAYMNDQVRPHYGWPQQ